MIKKVISLGMTLTFALSMASVSIYAETENVDFRYRQMVDMGFMNDDEDPDYIVTRGEFAKIVCAVRKLDNETGVTRYSDVTYESDYYQSISTVTAHGIMVGCDNGEFEPNRPITAEEAIKSFAVMAGYDGEAETYGGYPKGYTAVADKLKLFKFSGIKNYSAPIKQKELGVMLYNLLLAPATQINSAKYGYISVSQSDESFAEKYLGLDYITGVVDSNDYTNFSGIYSSIPDDTVAIGDCIVRNKKFSDRFYIGRYVSVFYDKETDEIISIVEREEDENIISVMSYDVDGISDGRLYYTKDNEDTHANFSKDIKYIYNDKTVLSFDFATLNTKSNYRLTLIDSDDDKRYDVIFIEDYYTVISDGVNSSEEVINKLMRKNDTDSTYSSGKTVNIDDKNGKKVLICDENYKELEGKDIKNGDVLTVIENENYVRIMISKAVTSCTVKGIEKGIGTSILLQCDIGEFYTVDELIYFIQDNNMMGKQVVIYTDIFKNAAYIQISEATDKKIGLLINARILTEDIDVDRAICFKLFTKDAEEKKIISSDKIKINNTSYKADKFTQLPDVLDGVENVPVIYRTNKDGRIVEIEIPENMLAGNTDGFFKGASVSNVTYNVYQKTFGAKIECGENTVSFILNSGTYDKNTSNVIIGNSTFDTTRTYTLDSYYISRADDIADVLVFKSNLNTVNFEATAAVVTNTSLSEVKDDEECRKIEYLTNGTLQEAYVSKDKYPNIDISALGIGDTIRLSVDKDGYLCDFVHIYSCIKEKYMQGSNPTSTSYTDSLVAGWGYAVSSNNGRIRISGDKKEIKDTSVYNLPMQIITGFDIIMVENIGNKYKIQKCTEADVKVGDKVVWITRSGRGKLFVIYK